MRGPSRGLLRDCTTSPINRFAALLQITHLAVPLARSVERVLVDAGVDMSSSAALLVLVQGEGDGAGQPLAVTGTRRRLL